MTNERYPQRQRPTHPSPIERFNEPVIVQVSVCTQDRQPVLACEAAHRLCREVWQGADFWRVGQYVIMPDHIHLFCAPGRVPLPSLKQWVEYWKGQMAVRWPLMSVPGGSTSVSAEGTMTDGTEAVPPGGTTDGAEPVPPEPEYGHGGPTSVPAVRTSCFKLWQRDHWDTQMRTREHYEEKLAYVRMNPVRKGLTKDAAEWPYQGVVFPIGWA